MDHASRRLRTQIFIPRVFSNLHTIPTFKRTRISRHRNMKPIFLRNKFRFTRTFLTARHQVRFRRHTLKFTVTTRRHHFRLVRFIRQQFQRRSLTGVRIGQQHIVSRRGTSVKDVTRTSASAIFGKVYGIGHTPLPNPSLCTIE